MIRSNAIGILAALALVTAAPLASADVVVGVDGNGDGDCGDLAALTAGPLTVEFGEAPASFGNSLVEDAVVSAGLEPEVCVGA